MWNDIRLNLSDEPLPDLPPQVDLAEQRDRGVVVRGELDLSSVHQLRAAASAAYRAIPDDAEGPQTFVVDMTGVTFIDSSGVHALTEILRQAEARDWSMEVLAPRAAGPRRLLRFAAAHGWLSTRPVDSAGWTP